MDIKGKDFDFIAFYQGPRTWKSAYNLHRWQDAYRLATGVTPEVGKEYPFSVKPARKVGGWTTSSGRLARTTRGCRGRLRIATLRTTTRTCS